MCSFGIATVLQHLLLVLIPRQTYSRIELGIKLCIHFCIYCKTFFRILYITLHQNPDRGLCAPPKNMMPNL
jgi:hypothetical protein